MFLSWGILLKAQYPIFKAGETGLQQMCEYLLEVDYKTRRLFTKTLIPDLKDCQQAFGKEKAKDIYRFLRKISQRHLIILTPEYKEQNTFHIHQATKADFSQHTEAAKNFPGGYMEMAQHLKEGLPYYKVVFTEEGRLNGSSFELLAYVNGKWCLFLSPWVVCMD